MNPCFGGFWRRLWAFSIDQSLIYLLWLILLVVGSTALGIRLVPARMEITVEEVTMLVGFFFLAYLLFAVALHAFYFIYFHGTTGQMLGKRMAGLRVMQATGEPVRPGTAFLRWVGCLVSFFGVFAGFLWVAVDRRKQGWHDKIAGTVVVRVQYAGQPELWAKKPLTKGGILYT